MDQVKSSPQPCSEHPLLRSIINLIQLHTLTSPLCLWKHDCRNKDLNWNYLVSTELQQSADSCTKIHNVFNMRNRPRCVDLWENIELQNPKGSMSSFIIANSSPWYKKLTTRSFCLIDKENNEWHFCRWLPPSVSLHIKSVIFHFNKYMQCNCDICNSGLSVAHTEGMKQDNLSNPQHPYFHQHNPVCLCGYMCVSQLTEHRVEEPAALRQEMP